MTVTASIITLYNPATDETRDIALRHDYSADFAARLDRHLHRFMNPRGLEICGVTCYQQPSFRQSLVYHLTGEVI